MTVQDVGNKQPVYVSGIYARPYTIRNSGTFDVLLGTDSSLALGVQAMTLPRGGTMQWSGATELWALCKAGETSQIEYIYEGASSVTDGATITTLSGPVSISGPVDVSGSVVAVSGSVTVNGAVTVSGIVSVSGPVTVNGSVAVTGTVAVSGPVTVNGTVALSGGTINVGTIAGGTVTISAGTIDLGSPVSIAAKPFPIPGHPYGISPTASTTLQTFTLSPNVQVGEYSSVIFQISINYAGATPALNIGSWLELEVRTGNRRFIGQWLIDETLNDVMYFQVPVLSDFIQIYMRWKNASAAYQPTSVVIQALGSGEALVEPRYVSTSDQMVSTLPNNGFFSQAYATGAAGSVFLGSRNLESRFNVINDSTTTINANAKLFALLSGVAYQLSSGFIPAGFGDTTERTFVAPLAPLRLDYVVGAGSAMRVAITQ